MERLACTGIIKWQRSVLLLLLLVSQIPLIACRVGTGVSGFGASNAKKTIFPILSVDGNITGNIISAGQKVAATTTIQKADPKLVTDSPRMWVQKTRDPDTLWVQIRQDGKPVRTMKLSVNVETGDWKVQQDKSLRRLDASEWIPVEGFYGIYKVPSGVLWVLVSKTESVYTAPSVKGEKNWWQIRRVSNFEIVHLGRPNMLLTPSHLKEEVRQLRLLRKALKQHEFYYVPDESTVVKDMTQTLQKSLQHHIAGEQGDDSWFDSAEQQPDPRFFWNQAAVEPLLHRYSLSSDGSRVHDMTRTLLHNVIPLTSAFVGVQSNRTLGEGSSVSYDQILISRRSRFRAGTRFTRRGADATGAVANFAETEQICLTLDNKRKVQQVLSHLQIRGSIPLRWSSPADVKTYRPRVRIGTDPLAQARALKLHLLEQFAFYTSADEEIRDSAKLVIVNLIDKKSDQGRLGRAFDAVLRAVLDVHSNTTEGTVNNAPALKPGTVEHVWYDFHAEVKDGKWDRLRFLLKDLEPALKEHGFFYAEAPTKKNSWEIKRVQNAIIRTNCMDCLDRSNVVQSLLGRYILFHQLLFAATESAGKSKKDSKDVWPGYAKQFAKNQMQLPWFDGESSHRLLWADNADAISRLYAGTPALKRDFTRHGTRTKKGALDDGMNSLQRYYLNNFMDADRQEGMDLMVGYANFSNVAFSEDDDFEDEEEPPSTVEGEDNFAPSVQEAARETLMGSILESLANNERNDLQLRLGDIGVKKRSLDLRWLPGDLQCHLISQADGLRTSSRRAKTEGDNKAVDSFCSSTALEAIDRRASSFLPWWAEYTDVDEKGQSSSALAAGMGETGFETGLVLPLSRHQQEPNITPFQLFGVAMLGIKAPIGLASAVVALLGFVFLPAILQQRPSWQSATDEA